MSHLMIKVTKLLRCPEVGEVGTSIEGTKTLSEGSLRQELPSNACSGEGANLNEEYISIYHSALHLPLD